MQAQAIPAPWLSYVIPVVVVAVVMALRWRRMGRARSLRIETLWILPMIYLVIVGVIFVTVPPGPTGWLWSALALIVGAVAGWYRGRMMRITVDPETHKLSQQASPAAMLLLIVLVVVRSAARQEFTDGNPASPAALLATDVAMAFALGLIGMTRIEMIVRARRLLAEARATRLTDTFS